MRTVTTKTKSTSTQTAIIKTDYWLNVKSSVSNVGINLAKGIKQHDIYISLIEKVGIDKVNALLKAKGEPLYVVQEGVSSNDTHLDSLLAEINSL